jgi:hypothetical protein
MDGSLISGQMRPSFYFRIWQNRLDCHHILLYIDIKMPRSRPTGPDAARLRQRKYALLQRLRIPPEALPGSLSLSYTRCGKSTCHCVTDPGHPAWSLTYMYRGQKRVQRIPEEWVEELRPLVAAGRAFKEAVAEVFAINAELLVLRRRQQKR